MNTEIIQATTAPYPVSATMLIRDENGPIVFMTGDRRPDFAVKAKVFQNAGRSLEVTRQTNAMLEAIRDRGETWTPEQLRLHVQCQDILRHVDDSTAAAPRFSSRILADAEQVEDWTV